ncbi:MAG: serine/threonine protein kinase [Mariprofundaceae bacterium]|nr:serine/threonine protein kinase [Mariprofundaceae bacterium]
MAEAEKDTFHHLEPHLILDAIDAAGFRSNGILHPLNSYENRVYEVGLADGAPIIAKFYRPARWTDAAILEEHRFTLELAELEIPVVPPVVDEEGRSLFHHGPYRFALYPKKGGHAPDLESSSQLKQLGRFIGRIHALGAAGTFVHRPVLSIEHFGEESRNYLLQHGFIPPELEEAYARLTKGLLNEVRALFDRAGDVHTIRLHGDCHSGNILWSDDGPHIVDFDDARMGPAVQDLWMFISGNRQHMQARLADLLEGYSRFHDFDVRELNLIEALRTLRMMHYAAWLARRWDDPAFKRAFPWFNTQNYWEDHILSLKEQASAMHEEPLQWI